MACSMELLNFMEECEKPTPPPELCFDIMELIGKQVDIIRQTKENKKKYGECINALNTTYYMEPSNRAEEDQYNLFDHWVEWYMDHDCWLDFLATNANDGVFVDRFYSP